MRFVSVGTVYDPDGGAIHLDLEVSNQSAYEPFNASLNTMVSHRFAQINLACNRAVCLRLSVVESSASARSCVACTEPSLSSSERQRCFAAGCACWG